MKIYYMSQIYYDNDNRRCASRVGPYYLNRDTVEAICKENNAEIENEVEREYQKALSRVEHEQAKIDALVEAGLESPRTIPPPYKPEVKKCRGYAYVSEEEVVEA